MPVTQAQLDVLAKHSHDLWLRNSPVDQIAKERPLLELLTRKKRVGGFSGQYIRETLLIDYQSNFQWYYGDQTLTYNRRDTLEEAKFDYGSVHDGWTAHEDDFIRAGLVIDSEKKNPVTQSEREIIADFFENKQMVLREGFKEKFDYEMHLDGTQSADSVPGLDAMITTNGQGTYGTIDSTANVWWQNNFDATLTPADMVEKMELQNTKITKYGGRTRTILCGEEFFEEYRKANKAEIQTHVQVSPSGQQRSFDAGVDMLKFKNVDVILDHTFADVQAATSAAVDWNKRAYMIDTNHINYRPIRGNDMKSFSPTGNHDDHVMYWGLKHKFALTMNKRRVHSLVALA